MGNRMDLDNATAICTEIGNKRRESQNGSTALTKATVGWTGKNRLNYAVGTKQAIGADGTITDNASMYLSDYIYIEDRQLIFSADSVTGSVTGRLAYYTNAKVFISRTTKNTFPYTDNVPDNAKYVRVCVERDDNNYLTNPMLRPASISDSTFEPYHPSVEEEINQVYADNGVLGAKNLLDVSSAKGDTTFITAVDDDGTLHFGDVSTVAWSALLGELNLIAGKEYIFSASAFTYGRIAMSKSSTGTPSSSTKPNITGGDALAIIDKNNLTSKFTANETTKVYIKYCNDTWNSSHAAFTTKLMLRLASDTDSTYQPYAMTNRDLTEMMAVQESAITLPEGATATANVLYKYGKVVQLYLNVTGITANQYVGFATIPEGYRTKKEMVFRTSGGTSDIFGIRANGQIYDNSGNLASATTVILNCMWITP